MKTDLVTEKIIISAVTNLNIDSKLKNTLIEFVLSNKTRNRYYLNYPLFFNAAFNIDDTKELKNMSIAAYWMLLSLLFTDKIIDDSLKHEKIIEYLLLSQICAEESIKLFCSYFDYQSTYWEHWMQAKYEFISAIKEDDGKNNSFTNENYRTLALNKSSFATCVVDALFLMTNCVYKENYQDIKIAHDKFSILLQILDDMSDVEIDFKAGRINYAIIKTLEHPEYPSSQKDNVIYIGKFFVVHNIYQDIYRECQSYISFIRKLCTKYNLTQWSLVLDEIEDKINSNQQIIKSYLKDLSEWNN